MSQILKIMRKSLFFCAIGNLTFTLFLISGDSSIITDDKDFEGSEVKGFGKNV